MVIINDKLQKSIKLTIIYCQLGGITEGFEFQMDEDTEVFHSCSAMLNGDLFVFGGYDGHKRKQVSYKPGLLNRIIITLLAIVLIIHLI